MLSSPGGEKHGRIHSRRVMKVARQFLVWHPVLTDHQAYTYEALAKQAAIPLSAYVQQMEDETRRTQGWRDLQVTSIKRQLIPVGTSAWFCCRQLMAHRHDIHFFGSAFESPLLMLCLLIASLLDIEFYLISEPYSPKSLGYFSDQQKLKVRIKTSLRPMLYWLYTRILLRKAAGIFAISRLALEQYQQAGIPIPKLLPFGYFIPQTISPKASQASEVLRLVFVGSLIRRKGLDILIDAVERLIRIGNLITLDVFGPGDPGAFAMEGHHINYCGVIPFGQTQEIISNYDLMVLPSRYDGWGVVVNEALCSGVPVICSDQVGAGVLVDRFGAGACFPDGDIQALVQLLSQIQNDRSRLNQMRQASITAIAAIQPEVAAAYMRKVINTPAPDEASVTSPWYPTAS